LARFKVKSCLWRRDNGECQHDAVRIFLADFADEQGSHTGSRATAEGVCELEALKAVAALGFLADNIEDRVDELGALCVVALGPVVAGTTLAEHKVVWPEDLTEWAGPDRVHCARLEVDKDGTWNVFATYTIKQIISILKQLLN